jgi:probable F420-dependent oxidoreductase
MGITYGVSLPSRGLLATPDNLMSTAMLIEKYHFDSGWVSDHIVIPKHIESKYPYSPTGASPFIDDQPYFEPISTLNFLAGCTNKIKLGTHVLIVPYRNPVLTAKMLSSLDALSKGRLIVGVGVGWMEEEFEALGLDTYKNRGRITDEYLTMYKQIWTGHQSENHSELYKIQNSTFTPAPDQKPHPPIWVGGHSKAAIRRAAQFGDAWMPIGGRPPSILEPIELAHKYAELNKYLNLYNKPQDSVELCFSSTVTLSNDPEARHSMMCGIPEQVASDIRSYQDVGVRNFIFSFNGTNITQLHENIQRFSEEVLSLIP